MDFFTHRSRWPFSLHPCIDGYRCQYDQQYFQDDLFSLYQVAGLPTVANAVVKRKAEFFAGRYCAKQVLDKNQFENFALVSNDNRSPHWPVGWVGSISHTDDKAACVVAKQRDYLGLGIDIENWIEERTIAQISSSIINSQEHTLLQTLSLPFQQAFTLVFSAKESLFKALNPQVHRFFGFEAAQVIAVDVAEQTLEIELLTDLSERYSASHSFTAEFDIQPDSVTTAIFIKA